MLILFGFQGISPPTSRVLQGEKSAIAVYDVQTFGGVVQLWMLVLPITLVLAALLLVFAHASRPPPFAHVSCALVDHPEGDDRAI